MRRTEQAVMWVVGRSRIAHMMRVGRCRGFGRSWTRAHSTYEGWPLGGRHGGIIPGIVVMWPAGLVLPGIGGYCSAGPGEGRRCSTRLSLSPGAARARIGVGL